MTGRHQGTPSRRSGRRQGTPSRRSGRPGLAAGILILTIGAMSTYALTRFRFRGAQALLNTYTAGMIFPIFLAVVPLFLLLGHQLSLDPVCPLCVP